MLKQINVLINKVEQCAYILGRIYVLLIEYTDRQENLLAKQPLRQESTVFSLLDIGHDDELLTIDDTCYRLGITRTTLRSLRRQGLLSDVKRGGRGVRFRAVDVEKLRKWYSVPKGKV